MIDYIKAIKRPFTDFKKLLIGIVLSLPIPYIRIITNLIAFGYVLECGNSASKNDYKLPTWNNLVNLIKNGILSLLISLIYLIPLIVLGFTLIKNLFRGALLNPVNFYSMLFNNTGTFLDKYGFELVLLVVVGTLISYVLPVGLLNFVNKNRFENAFNWNEISPVVSTKKYFSVWVMTSIIFLLEIIVITLIIGSFFAPVSKFSDEKMWENKDEKLYNQVLENIGEQYPNLPLANKEQLAKNDYLRWASQQNTENIGETTSEFSNKVLVINYFDSIIVFILSIFSFTLYGNVMKEIK